MRRTLIPMLAVPLLDVLVKASAQRMLPPGEPVPIAADLFRLTLGYNSGVAFGLFAGGGRWPLVVSGIIIAGLGAWVMHALRAGRLAPAASWPIGLILGGAIANFGDRLPDGRVTDFLDVGVGAHSLADVQPGRQFHRARCRCSRADSRAHQHPESGRGRFDEFEVSEHYMSVYSYELGEFACLRINRSARTLRLRRTGYGQAHVC